MYHWKWYLNYAALRGNCDDRWKWYLNYAALRGNCDDSIYIYMGGIEYHITTNLAIVIVSLMSLYMWYTKEYSLWMKTWHGCILWCPVWHSGNIEWKQDIEGLACSVLYAVHRAGDGVLNLISARQSDDWEGIFVAVETSSSIYLSIISLNHPHLQLVTPLWPPIPLQPHHPHPITIHTPQPPTSFQPHTTKNHIHSKTTHTPKPPTPTQLLTPINHTYPPTTHIPSNHTYFSITHTWCQSILHKWIDWCSVISS